MKKILLFGAALVAAMSMNAQTPIAATCAEAAAAMPAQNGDETADVYVVTGYVTNTNGAISPSRTDPSIDQQTFYMDDVKGSKKTLQGYWCNLPGHEALNVGDKITLTGKILNYSNTPEIKNGDVVILERASVTVDTIPATACEAIEEGGSLNDLDYSDEVFIVTGRLSGPDNVNSYGQHTCDLVCTESDVIFEAYNCTGADGLELGMGDSVKVIGKLYNYHGKIEISNGKIELVEKSQVEVVAIEVNVAEAVAVAIQLPENGKTNDLYAITGYVDSIAIEYSEQYKNISFFMTDDMNNPTYDLEAYRVKVEPEDAAKVFVGAKVKVTAQLQHYYKAATDEQPAIDLAETVAGGEIEFIVEEGVDNILSEQNATKRLENGQLIIYRNGTRFTATGTQVR